MSDKKPVKGTVDDLVCELLDDGREEDEELPRGAIEDMIERGELTEDEIVEWFRVALHMRLKSA